jgi:hypothetical protein
MVYVASHFEPERRREELSWSHHAELAALDPAEQARWLTLAAARRLSVHSLRLELRAARKASLGQGADESAIATGEAAPASAGCIVCPNCRHVIGANAGAQSAISAHH